MMLREAIDSGKSIATMEVTPAQELPSGAHAGGGSLISCIKLKQSSLPPVLHVVCPDRNRPRVSSSRGVPSRDRTAALTRLAQDSC